MFEFLKKRITTFLKVSPGYFEQTTLINHIDRIKQHFKIQASVCMTQVVFRHKFRAISAKLSLDVYVHEESSMGLSESAMITAAGRSLERVLSVCRSAGNSAVHSRVFV